MIVKLKAAGVDVTKRKPYLQMISLQRNRNFMNALVYQQELKRQHILKILARHIDRYLKNSVSKSIVLVIKHAKVSAIRVHTNRVIYKNLKIEDKFINKRVPLFIHQAMCPEEKNISTS